MPKGIYKHKSHQGFQKGHLGYKFWLGKKISEETKKKISKKQKGMKKPWVVSPTKGKHHSNETLKKMSEAQKGEKSYRWKGGISNKEMMAGRPKPKQCEICGKNGRICFDNNHETGEFRGWICDKCNTALGMVSDNIEILTKMINYLKK